MACVLGGGFGCVFNSVVMFYVRCFVGLKFLDVYFICLLVMLHSTDVGLFAVFGGG